MTNTHKQSLVIWILRDTSYENTSTTVISINKKLDGKERPILHVQLTKVYSFEAVNKKIIRMKNWDCVL